MIISNAKTAKDLRPLTNAQRSAKFQYEYRQLPEFKQMANAFERMFNPSLNEENRK